MATQLQHRTQSDDPRKLRGLFNRTRDLAQQEISTVVVGLAGGDGDLLFPEFVGFVESALRVEDAIFRMTRDRAVTFLTDVNEAGATHIMQRLQEDFRERFSSSEALRVELGFFAVPPGRRSVTAKEILPALFAAKS